MTKEKINYDILGTEAPKCPEILPRMLRQMVENAPEHMKPAILNSAFPALGALMHNVRFRYPDNVCHEPHFMCGMVGPMSLGKGSINPIIETIIRTLREHDEQSNAKLNEWKKQCKTDGWRIIDARCTMDDGATRADLLADEEDWLSDWIHREDLAVMQQVLQSLTKKEQSVITRLYGIGCERVSATDIANEMHIDPSVVQHLHKHILKKMHKKMQSN